MPYLPTQEFPIRPTNPSFFTLFHSQLAKLGAGRYLGSMGRATRLGLNAQVLTLPRYCLPVWIKFFVPSKPWLLCQQRGLEEASFETMDTVFKTLTITEGWEGGRGAEYTLSFQSLTPSKHKESWF